MKHYGYRAAGSTLVIYFESFDSNGASVTLTGLAVTDIEIYKNGSTTQRSSDSGYALLDTDGIDFDGAVGIHGFSIDLSDDTDSGFFATGSSYAVMVDAVTIDGQTVRFTAAEFDIGPVPADMIQLGSAAQSATDLKDFADAGYDPATNKVQGVVLVDTVTTNTDMRGTDSAALASVNTEARLAELDAGNLPSDNAAIKADTGAILADTAEIGTAGAGLTDLGGMSTGMKAEVNAEVDTALSDMFTSAAQLVDDIWDEILTGAAHNVAASAARRLREISDTLVLAAGTAQAGAAGTLTLAAGADANDDFYNDTRIVIVGGTGVGQARVVHDYDGTSKIATIAPDWVVAPDNTSDYQVQSQSNVHVHELEPNALAQILSDSTAFAGADIAAIKVITDALTAAAAAKLALSAGTIVSGTVNDAVTTPTTTVFAANDITEATADHFNGRVIIFTSGTLQYQATDITDYELASGEGKFTVTAMTEAAADGDTFIII